eukprot:3494_1
MGEPADPSEGRPVVDLDALRAKARATEEVIGVRECEPSELQRLSFHMNLSASEKEEKSSFALPSGPTTVAAPQEQRATTSEPPRLRVNGKLADVPYLTMRSLRKDFAHELGYVEEKGDDFIFPPQKYLSHHMQFVPCASPDSAYVVNVVDVVDENESKNPLLVRSSDELECADDDLCVELWLLRQELARQIGENELIRGSLRNNIDLGQLLQKQASMAEMNSVWAEYRKAHVRCRICKKVGCDHMTAAPARVLTETWADQDKAAAMVSAGEISDDEDYLEPSFVRRQQRSRMRREVRAQARRTVARPIQVPTRPRSSKKSSEEIETERQVKDLLRGVVNQVCRKDAERLKEERKKERIARMKERHDRIIRDKCRNCLNSIIRKIEKKVAISKPSLSVSTAKVPNRTPGPGSISSSPRFVKSSLSNRLDPIRAPERDSRSILFHRLGADKEDIPALLNSVGGAAPPCNRRRLPHRSAALYDEFELQSPARSQHPQSHSMRPAATCSRELRSRTREVVGPMELQRRSVLGIDRGRESSENQLLKCVGISPDSLHSQRGRVQPHGLRVNVNLTSHPKRDNPNQAVTPNDIVSSSNFMVAAGQASPNTIVSTSLQPVATSPNDVISMSPNDIICSRNRAPVM